MKTQTSVTAETLTAEQRAAVRPKVDFSSAGAFVKSAARRVASIFTKRFIFSLFVRLFLLLHFHLVIGAERDFGRQAGQIVSLCIVATSVASSQLAIRGFNLPTTQTLFQYASSLLCLRSYKLTLVQLLPAQRYLYVLYDLPLYVPV